MPIEMLDDLCASRQIRVVGVGGAGGNAVEHMIAQGMQGAEFICANTDAAALARSSAKVRILLGRSGLGAGGDPEHGRQAAQQVEEQIRAAVDGAQVVFVIAGMGGGTGTGAAPVIARVAREMGSLTVGIVTKPFEFEGARRARRAELGSAELEENVDAILVIPNEKLLEMFGDDVTQEQAFTYANDMVNLAVGGIGDLIVNPGLINVDVEDVKTVMSEPGKAMLGTAVASDPDRAIKAAEAAVACPLLEGQDLSVARGILVVIAASKSTLKLSESRMAMNAIRRYVADDAHVIYGTAYDDKLGDQLRVTVVATGLTSVRESQTEPPRAVEQRQHAHEGSVTPSVWRRTRSQASAKVDALASEGMDEIEIPAFLRKQAD